MHQKCMYVREFLQYVMYRRVRMTCVEETEVSTSEKAQSYLFSTNFQAKHATYGQNSSKSSCMLKHVMKKNKKSHVNPPQKVTDFGKKNIIFATWWLFRNGVGLESFVLGSRRQ